MSSNGYLRMVECAEVEEAYALEIISFPSDLAATKEKLVFRQQKAPELFWGYFEEGRLIAFVTGTKTSKSKLTADSNNSHDADGTVVCVHSVCVLPEFRRKGIATSLLKHYIQNTKENLLTVTKICLLSEENLIQFYEKCGFECKGPSEVVHGSVQWFDMEYAISR